MPTEGLSELAYTGLWQMQGRTAGLLVFLLSQLDFYFVPPLLPKSRVMNLWRNSALSLSFPGSNHTQFN